MISTVYLSNNELVGAHIIEILTIPDISIISKDNDDIEKTTEKYQADFGSLLSEIHQYYKAQNSSGFNSEFSIEFMWLSEPVVNQPYKAKVRLFCICRAISANLEIVENTIASITQAITSTLSLQKYNYQSVGYDQFGLLVANIDKESMKAVVKDEYIENLHNQILPYCYLFDCIPSNKCQDLSKIANTLINYPNCAISFQLTPTSYTHNEIMDINTLSQTLDTLYNGVSEHGMGNISLSLAEKASVTYKYYSQNKNKSLFNYNIIIWGSSNSTANIASRLYGQLTPSSQDAINLKTLNLYNADLDIINNFYPLPWAINEYLISYDRNANIWSTQGISVNLYRLPYIITAEEASEFFRLPFGTERITAGFSVNMSGKSSKTYSNNIINAGDIEVGKLKSSFSKDYIGMSLKDLAKHMLVVGTPGSGKTTFSVGLLDRLWKDHKIPFLVIEPAKNEYRALVQSIPDLQVFTPGKNFISPFIFNPFVLPKNVRLETYKSTLKTAFAAGVSMSTPLDKIFEEAINNCYSDFRWLNSYTSDDKGKNFNISDFINCFQETFDKIGYTGDARNIGRAGVVRLKSLINLFDNYHSIPIEDILTKPTIIELSAIENNDQKALIIALVLLSILSYVNANYVGEGGLRNFILLEEAHVLLDSSSGGGDTAANPSAIAQGLVKRMLAEIRSYGVGLAIADQSTRKVGIDIVALTDIKVAFRLVEGSDKEILADSIGMTDTQVSRLSKLKPGEAFFFFNKLDEPEEIVTPDYRLNNEIDISLSDDSIKELSTYWRDKQDKLRPYVECEKTPYCTTSCDYSRRMLAQEVARRIFIKNFNTTDKTSEPIKKVLANIKILVEAELNDEVFSRELLSCVKVYLWRRIKYETSIPLNEDVVNKSLSRI